MWFLAPFSEASGISLCRDRILDLKKKKSHPLWQLLCLNAPCQLWLGWNDDIFSLDVKETQGLASALGVSWANQSSFLRITPSVVLLSSLMESWLDSEVWLISCGFKCPELLFAVLASINGATSLGKETPIVPFSVPGICHTCWSIKGRS